MENFAKPSVLKNHMKSYSSAIKAVQDDLNKKMDDLVNNENEYKIIADKITEYSKKRESLIKSLESKFKKYNLDFKQPLISNDLDTIIKYSENLESELNISLASLNGEERDNVLNDSKSSTDEISQLKELSTKIEDESKKLLDYEKELFKDRPQEKDANEEKIINFNDYLKDKKEEPVVEEIENENDDLVKIINDELNIDTISASIFEENEENDNFLSDFNESYEEALDIESSAKAKLNPGSSFNEKVNFVYGEGYIDKVYNYGNNKKIIDKRAEDCNMTPEEAMNDKEALSGSVIEFPTEPDKNNINSSNIVEFPTEYDYEESNDEIKRLG